MALLRNRQRRYVVVTVGLVAHAVALSLIASGQMSVPIVARSVGSFQIEVPEAEVEQIGFRPLPMTDVGGVEDTRPVIDGPTATGGAPTADPGNTSGSSSGIGLGLLQQGGSDASPFVVDLEVSSTELRPVLLNKTFNVGAVLGRPQYLRWSVGAEVSLENVRLKASPFCAQAVIADRVVVGDASSEASRSTGASDGEPAPLGVRAESFQAFNIDLRTRHLTIGKVEFLDRPGARLLPTSSPSPAFTCVMPSDSQGDR